MTDAKAINRGGLKNFIPLPITIGITVVCEDIKFLIQR